MITTAFALAVLLGAAPAPAPAVPAAAPPRLQLTLPPLRGAPAPAELRLDAVAPFRPDDGRSDGAAGPPGSAPAADGERATRLRAWGRVLRWSTGAALVATSALGTMAAMNQPTVFADGRCITGSPVLGVYGCDRGLSTLHGASGVLSATLYTASGVLSLAAPEAAPRVEGAVRPWHRALGWVHLGGIVVQPIIGLVSAFPQVIGRERTAPTDPFPRRLRTAHVFIGSLTTAAFLASLALER